MPRLQAWKQSQHRKPLILHGARQVGKTWLLKSFGQHAFGNVAYVNFDGNPAMHNLFDQGYHLPALLEGLQIGSGERIVPGKTLLIFDEIQECPKALTSLKYFSEDLPKLAVAAAGSLLGLTVHEGTGYPVGKVTTLPLYPLTFWEYLDAVGAENLRELLESGNTALIAAFSAQLTANLRNYMYVGGMPEAVAAFVETRDYQAVREIQNGIVSGYQFDISKHVEPRKLEAVLAVFRAIPAQLSKENKRLVFGQVREGGRARDFIFALTWLQQAGIAVVVPRISKPDLPLNAYAEANGRQQAFKLFLADVGLLGAMARLPAAAVLAGDTIFEEFKGALTEQYVCQQLISGLSLEPFYWAAEKGAAEVDFVVQQGTDVFGLEVKAAENLRAKSLRTFHSKYPDTTAVRFSLSDYRQQDWMVNVPLYAVQNRNLWTAQRAEDEAGV